MKVPFMSSMQNSLLFGKKLVHKIYCLASVTLESEVECNHRGCQNVHKCTFYSTTTHRLHFNLYVTNLTDILMNM
jgi:hypothetical protein